MPNKKNHFTVPLEGDEVRYTIFSIYLFINLIKALKNCVPVMIMIIIELPETSPQQGARDSVKMSILQIPFYQGQENKPVIKSDAHVDESLLDTNRQKRSPSSMICVISELHMISPPRRNFSNSPALWPRSSLSWVCKWMSVTREEEKLWKRKIKIRFQISNFIYEVN